MTCLRVVVCGGRMFKNRAMVFAALDCLHDETPIAAIIEGGAKGVDQFAFEWAMARGIALVTYAANWLELGKAAGPIRNQEMIDEGRPDLCVAFPGGRGTEDMVRRCVLAGIEVRHIQLAVSNAELPAPLPPRS